MLDVDTAENTFSDSEADDRDEPGAFDPEHTSADDEIDGDTLAFRDAMHDIWASEGRFEVLLP
jgi:hypothetical protein